MKSATAKNFACIFCQRTLGRIGADFTGKEIYHCSDCDYLVTPSAPADAATMLYDDPEYFEGWGSNLEFDYNRFEPTVHQQISEYLDFIEQHTEGKSLLDVGTGSGLLPHMARARGYEVEGTDLSRHVSAAVPLRAGFRIHQGMIEEIRFDRQYDIITMLHVLEHTSDPLSTMNRAREILDAEGFIVVVVPNYRSLDTRIKNVLSQLKLKSRPYKHLALGHHNYIFSIRSLEVLGRKSNLRIINRETRQPVRRAGNWHHRLFEHLEMATWCWIVYQKITEPD